MKLHILSDLHLEFAAFTPPETDADVVLLPGDINLGVAGIEWAQKAFKKPVIYVPGNHEYYREHEGKMRQKLRSAAAGSNVHLLDNDMVIIEGVRFLGGTLWTDFRYGSHQAFAMQEAKRTLPDFRSIRTDVSYRKLHPRDTVERHSRTLQFLREQLALPFAGKTVVLSHHAPGQQSVEEQYVDDDLTSAYASRLEHLFGPGIVLWAHGHMHHSVDTSVAGTRVICNPRGYAPKELNSEFNPGLVVGL